METDTIQLMNDLQEIRSFILEVLKEKHPQTYSDYMKEYKED